MKRTTTKKVRKEPSPPSLGVVARSAWRSRNRKGPPASQRTKVQKSKATWAQHLGVERLEDIPNLWRIERDQLIADLQSDENSLCRLLENRGWHPKPKGNWPVATFPSRLFKNDGRSQRKLIERALTESRDSTAWFAYNMLCRLRQLRRALKSSDKERASLLANAFEAGRCALHFSRVIDFHQSDGNSHKKPHNAILEQYIESALEDTADEKGSIVDKVIDSLTKIAPEIFKPKASLPNDVRESDRSIPGFFVIVSGKTHFVRHGSFASWLSKYRKKSQERVAHRGHATARR